MRRSGHLSESLARLNYAPATRPHDALADCASRSKSKPTRQEACKQSPGRCVVASVSPTSARSSSYSRTQVNSRTARCLARTSRYSTAKGQSDVGAVLQPPSEGDLGETSREAGAAHRVWSFGLGRDREFADSPLEEGGFEPLVPLARDADRIAKRDQLIQLGCWRLAT